MNDYEKLQIREINNWQNLEPNMFSQLLVSTTLPFSWLIQKIIPNKIMNSVIEGINEMGNRFADQDDIIRKGDVQVIADLKHKDLELSDQLAGSVDKWAIGLAVVEGAATGAGGFLSITVDIPLIITLAFRTIHKVGLCYGYEYNSDIDKQYICSILSASGANSVSEKAAALTALRSLASISTTQTVETLAEKSARKKIANESTIITLKKLSHQLGINFSKRKALQLLPAVGAIVGGSVNGWFISDVANAARRSFQQRWLDEKYAKN